MMQAKHRSRRLRKKLRVGEFQEIGFEASFQLRQELPKEELENLWDAFILEAIEWNGSSTAVGRMGSFPCRAAAPLRTRTGTSGAPGRLPKIIFTQRPCPCKPMRVSLCWRYAGGVDIIASHAATAVPPSGTRPIPKNMIFLPQRRKDHECVPLARER